MPGFIGLLGSSESASWGTAWLIRVLLMIHSLIRRLWLLMMMLCLYQLLLLCRGEGLVRFTCVCREWRPSSAESDGCLPVVVVGLSAAADELPSASAASIETVLSVKD